MNQLTKITRDATDASKSSYRRVSRAHVNARLVGYTPVLYALTLVVRGVVGESQFTQNTRVQPQLTLD